MTPTPKKMKEEQIAIGDVFTNGINHWMAWSVSRKCKCDSDKCPCGISKSSIVKVVPVSIKEGRVSEINFNYRGEYWFDRKLSSIKPYATHCGNLYEVTQ